MAQLVHHLQPVRVFPRQAFLSILFVLIVGAPVAGQDESVAVRARDAAAAGRRAEALAMLETHLAVSPSDVDARLVYGIVLSWEKRFDEARQALREVLAQAPTYADAQVALMQVEWLSGRTREARLAAEGILARDPGNTQARAIREQVEVIDRPWGLGISYANDSFNDDRPGWHETALSVTRVTPIGSVIARGSYAERFGLADRLYEVEMYPRVRPGTYAFVAVGYSADAVLYPTYRLAFDLYQSVGRGVELSGGVRRLGFDAASMAYAASVSKYVGRWMFTGKAFHVPGEGPFDSTSYHGSVRRYVRDDGASYIAATYSHGFSREEIRDLADLATLDSDTARAEAVMQFRRRIRVYASGGTSRQQRQGRAGLWQTSVSSGFVLLF